MTSVARVELSGDILKVSGSVDPLTVVSTRKQGEALIQSASGNLTVDLSALENAHSVVLSLLLCWQRCADELGRSLLFTGVSDRLYSLAALSNLEEQLSGFQPDGSA
ncbi:NTP binding protein (contains STAS domain) [Marinobacter lipolyticus SM19]|uniref:NTP binding protein (Contains STAS domain) n=1 Tax=Marinobacter lipolyticus SM19 TaxID=1318628 RepID=R8B535_9GAMM|nr:STAS domain-containing protein [Marinobacter lipolyticus]EON93730.1 NTP binding protein (contains STAS domain) [Marinobacter lipolyticus SM19]